MDLHGFTLVILFSYIILVFLQIRILLVNRKHRANNLEAASTIGNLTISTYFIEAISLLINLNCWRKMLLNSSFLAIYRDVISQVIGLLNSNRMVDTLAILMTLVVRSRMNASGQSNKILNIIVDRLILIKLSQRIDHKCQYTWVCHSFGRITWRKSEAQHICPFYCPHFVLRDKFCQFQKVIIQILWRKVHITLTLRQIKCVFHGSSKVWYKEIFEGSIFSSRI
jgi:hypothetical protein